MGKQKTIMLIITYNCNLRCSYCYEPKLQNFHMDASRAKRIIAEQVANLNDDYDSVEIQFMGGESLLEFPLIKEVSEWLWANPMNKKLLVLFAPTNGTLLTEEMKAWFTRNRDKINLGLSFDGDINMQDINRSNSYNKVDLDYFVKTWPNQSVKMTISPETIGNLSEGVKFLHEKGFRYISADLAMGPSINWTADALILYRMELSKLGNYYIEHPELIPFSMLRLDVTSVSTAKKTDVKTCSCGEDMVCVDWTGKTYACHLFSPVSIPVDKAKRSNEIYDFSNHAQFNSPICSKCMLNNLCSHCYGMNYICTGKVNEPSGFHCKAFKLLFAANCRFMLKVAEKRNDIMLQEKIYKVINSIV